MENNGVKHNITKEECQLYLQQRADELCDIGDMDKMELLRALTHIGDALLPYQELYKNENNRVHGCLSLVYIHGVCSENRMYYCAFCEPLVLKGYICILQEAFSGMLASDIVQYGPVLLQEFSDRVAQYILLSAGRSNALGIMWQRMYKLAVNCT